LLTKKKKKSEPPSRGSGPAKRLGEGGVVKLFKEVGTKTTEGRRRVNTAGVKKGKPRTKFPNEKAKERIQLRRKEA